MQLVEVKNDIVKILYSPARNHILPSDFLLINDVNQKLISQIINIETTDSPENNSAFLRPVLSIDKDENLSLYNGYIPSKAAEISVALGKEQKKEAGEMKKVCSLALAVCLLLSCFACSNVDQEAIYSSALAEGESAGNAVQSVQSMAPASEDDLSGELTLRTPVAGDTLKDPGCRGSCFAVSNWAFARISWQAYPARMGTLSTPIPLAST